MPAPVKVRFVSTGEKEVLAAFDSLEKKARDLANLQIREANRAATATSRAARRTGAAAHGNDPYRGRSVLDDERRLALAKERIAQDSAKRMDKIRERSALMAEREAKKAADAQIKEANRAAREIARATARQQRERRQVIGNAIRGTASSVSGMAAGIGATAGTAAMGISLMNAMSLEEQAALLSNATAMPGMTGVDPRQLMADARGTAEATGFKAADVMEAMGTVSARAGGARGLEAVRTDLLDIAKTAKSAGVSMKDMGAVYAAALNEGVKPGDEMRQLMIDLVAQGKAGSIEFSDLASELAKLGGAGKKFGSGSEMLRKVAGWAQIAVESKVSPEESRTAVIDMLREMTQGPKMVGMQQLGATMTKNGKLNDPAEIMADIIAGIEGGKTFGKGARKRGGDTDAAKMAAYSEFFTGASGDIALGLRETFLKAGGGAKGRAAILERVNSAVGKSGAMTPEQRNAEFSKVMETNAAKFAVETAKFEAEMAKLLPQITKLIPVVSQLMQSFAKLAVWAGENPMRGLGALFAARLGAEIASAQISSVIQKGFATGATGFFQKLGAVTMTAAAVYLTTKEVIDEANKMGDVEGKGRFAADIEATNLLSRIKHTGVAASDAEKAKGLLERLDSSDTYGKSIARKYLGVDKGGFTESMVGSALDTSGLGQLFGTFFDSAARSSSGTAGNEAELEQTKAALRGVIQSANQLATASKTAAAELEKVKGNSPTDPGNPNRNSPMSAR